MQFQVSAAVARPGVGEAGGAAAAAPPPAQAVACAVAPTTTADGLGGSCLVEGAAEQVGGFAAEIVLFAGRLRLSGARSSKYSGSSSRSSPRMCSGSSRSRSSSYASGDTIGAIATAVSAFRACRRRIRNDRWAGRSWRLFGGAGKPRAGCRHLASAIGPAFSGTAASASAATAATVAPRRSGGHVQRCSSSGFVTQGRCSKWPRHRRRNWRWQGWCPGSLPRQRGEQDRCVGPSSPKSFDACCSRCPQWGRCRSVSSGTLPAAGCR